MDQLALTACVVLGIVFGFAVAKFLSKGAMAALEAKVKAEAQREAVALGERVAAKESRLVELTRDNLDAKRRLEEALDHAARLNGAQQQFDAQLAEMKRQSDEKVALVTRSNERALESLRAAHEEKAEQAEKYAIELAARAETAREEAEALRDEVAALRAEQAEVEARMAAAGDSHAKLEQTFRTISAETFQQNNQAFMDLARAAFDRMQETPRADGASKQQSIDEAVRPLRDALARVAGAIAGMERDRVAALTGLSEQVGSLLTTQQQIHSETRGLAGALRAPASRGQWGEMQLRRVVELAGMIEHCDFEPAESPATLVIHLPSQREIAIDANVPLSNYLEAIDSADEARAAKFGEHAAAVRQHVSQLASPEYWSLFQRTPELVVAFLPGEAPFSAALEQDPALLEFGAAQHVILATPATLIALLRAAAYGWKQHQLTENAREISTLGQSLFENLRVYQTRMDEVRGNLERTVESYNAAAGTFESQVLSPVRRFHSIEPAEPVVIRPRAISAPPALALVAPAVKAEAPATGPEIEPESFSAPYEPAAAEPEPVPVFEAEPETSAAAEMEPEFDFEFEPEAEAGTEMVTLGELAPVEAEAAEPEIELAQPVFAEPAAIEAMPALTAVADPIPAAPVEPTAPEPENRTEDTSANVVAAPEAEAEIEPEPEPEMVAVEAVPQARVAIEIEEPAFPDFSPDLAAMASKVAPAPVSVISVPTAPAADAAAESSGFFAAFVKI